MEIIEKYGINEARGAEGQVIVIDVLRAFTTAAYAFNQGAAKIILVSSPQEALKLKERYQDFILVGEIEGRTIPGFDYGNSPEKISQLDLHQRTIVLRSSSGTQGVVHANKAAQIYLGSLVVAQATVQYLRSLKASPVTILAMGSVNGPDKEEDIACQKYMSSLFAQKPIALQEISDAVVNSPSGQMALDPKVDWKSPQDLRCAIAINKFNFIMPVTKEDGLLVAYAKASAREPF